MSSVYTIDRTHLQAALIIAPKTDIRTYLVGVLMETCAGADGTDVLLIATDGHRMSVSAAGTCDAESRRVSVIIPRQIAENVCRHKLSRNADQTVTVAVGHETESASVTCTMSDGTTFAGKAVDGCFPDWRRVSRKEKGDGAATRINPAYYGDIGNYFTKLLGSESSMRAGLCLDYGSGDTVMATVMATCGDARAYMVIMPMRSDAQTDFGMVNALSAAAKVEA